MAAPGLDAHLDGCIRASIFGPMAVAYGDCAMASILPFLRTKADFDDQVTGIIGKAFDAACAELRDPPDIVREVIAKRIIAAARKGERDPTRLRDIGLAALGPDRSEWHTNPRPRV